jgi:hypothetical protein
MQIPKLAKNLFIFNLFLTLLGCFLPWRVEGDFLFHVTYGLRIFTPVEYNGGFLVVLLCIILSRLIFWPPKAIKDPNRWIIAFSTGLALIALLHLVKWVVDYFNNFGIVGAPAIKFGLVIVFLGSLGLLLTSIWHSRKVPIG